MSNEKTIQHLLPSGKAFDSREFARFLRQDLHDAFKAPGQYEWIDALCGLHVFPDGWEREGMLRRDSLYTLRLPGRLCDYAIEKIEVTGHKVQWSDRARPSYYRCPKVRVRITFDSGDPNIPNTTTGGWLA